ncbi:MAG: hypothetical protein U0893_02165 [Chloroflexota bacterium]
MQQPRRFAIRVDPWFVPLLMPFGVVGGRREVTVDETSVQVCLGFWSHRFPRDQVVGVRRVAGNILYGVGWHTDFFRMLVVNGSLAGLVEIQFRSPQPFRLLGLPARCSGLRVSLEEPDAFVAALGG